MSDHESKRIIKMLANRLWMYTIVSKSFVNLNTIQHLRMPRFQKMSLALDIYK